MQTSDPHTLLSMHTEIKVLFMKFHFKTLCVRNTQAPSPVFEDSLCNLCLWWPKILQLATSDNRIEPTEMKHYLLLPMLASSYWAHLIKYLNVRQLLGIINCALPCHTSYQSTLWTLPCLFYCSSYYFFFVSSVFPGGSLGILVLLALQYTLCSMYAHQPIICDNGSKNFWRKVFLPHGSMLQGLLRPGEKESRPKRNGSYIPASVLTLGLTLQNSAWKFIFTGKL